MRRYFGTFFAVLAILMLIPACEKEDPSTTPTTPTTPTSTTDPVTPGTSHSEYYEINKYLRSSIFDRYYYWAENVKAANSKLDPDKYTTDDFFYEMLYSGDRWSWCMEGKEYGATTTVDGTWGISLGQPIEYYDDYGPYVCFIYPTSPLAKFGVTRGAHLMKISGTDVSVIRTQSQINVINAGLATSPQEFTFRLVDGRDTTFKASWSNMEFTTSLGHRIFTSDDFEGLKEPVGYFNYMSFNERYLTDIDRAMMEFREAGIKKLIVDLRYNNGGSSVASQRMMDYLTPEQYTGTFYSEKEFNKNVAEAYRNSKIDSKDYIRTTKNSFGNNISEYVNLGTHYEILDEKIVKPLSLEDVYFISGSVSASASEKLINELQPFLEGHTYVVGGKTYGKPNGMIIFYYPDNKESDEAYLDGEFDKLDYLFFPISFYTKNHNGGYIPDDGFDPDVYRADDLFHDFDEKEASINACLTHAATGVFPEPPAKTKSLPASGKKADFRVLPFERNEKQCGLIWRPTTDSTITETVK